MQRGPLALIAVLAFAGTAHANAAQSHFEGDTAAEPNGLRDVAIEHEDLAFDMRGLAEGGWGPHAIPVSAKYRIVNHGAEVTVPLVFASGSMVAAAFHVELDHQVVPTTTASPEQAGAMPATWNAPLTTPSLDGGAPLEYYGGGNYRNRYQREEGAAAFTLTISPGPHELSVVYGADVDWGYGNSGTVVYKAGYVLSPAREWASFGTLDLTVEVPAGWHAATSIPTVRTGDTLRGHFDKVPADTLGITTQAPVSVMHRIVLVALPILFVLVLFGGGFGLYRLGVWRAKKQSLGDAWTLMFFVWAIAIGVTGSATAFRATFFVPEEQAAAAHGYGAGLGTFGSVILALIALPIGYAIIRSGRRSLLPVEPPDPYRWR